MSMIYKECMTKLIHGYATNMETSKDDDVLYKVQRRRPSRDFVAKTLKICYFFLFKASSPILSLDDRYALNFSDATLNHVRTTLNDIAYRPREFRWDYFPKENDGVTQDTEESSGDDKALTKAHKDIEGYWQLGEVYLGGRTYGETSAARKDPSDLAYGCPHLYRLRYSNPMIQPELEGSTQGYPLVSVEVLRSDIEDCHGPSGYKTTSLANQDSILQLEILSRRFFFKLNLPHLDQRAISRILKVTPTIRKMVVKVAFWKSICFVRDLQGNDLLIGNRGSDLYTISLLSHLNFDYINLLSKKDIVIGLPKLKYVKDQLCSSCELSKAKRISFKTKVVPSSKGWLNLLHMDLCGPIGTKFLNNTLHAYFKEEGIEHQTSTPRTPEHNGIVERRNRTLVKAARTMLSAFKFPLFFCAEAIATACYTYNRSIIIPTHEKTTYHIINDRKPLIRHLYIFGCTCYLTRDGENLDKMKEKRDSCILFDEIKEMIETSVDNNTSGLIPQRKKASDYDNSGPAPQLQNVSPKQIQQLHHNKS
ncbi:retrovirus-related pol polyprotein from transposon TNT 1-94 [Tanacetum coccineum]